VEADIRYPSDAMLALQGARVLAREGRKVTGMIKDKRCGSPIVHAQLGGLSARSQRHSRAAPAKPKRR
jgi:hypothetical protein